MIALSLFVLSTFSTETISNTASAELSTDTYLTRGAGMILPPIRPKTNCNVVLV